MLAAETMRKIIDFLSRFKHRQNSVYQNPLSENTFFFLKFNVKLLVNI